MKTLACLFIRSPVRHWVWLFLAINMLINISGSDNPLSRWSMMAAMVEDHTVSIDHYYKRTCDWSRSPDGHYYSNKAPGPALIGYPLFWVMDKMDTHRMVDRKTREAKRSATWPDSLHTVSVVTQVIPYAIVTLLLLYELQKLGVPLIALHLSALALLFGNTSSLFMNSFFGHSMAAMYILASILAIQRRWPMRIGLFFGLAVLCDYGAAMLVPPLMIALLLRRLIRPKPLFALTVGAAGPALAFGTYHWYCFGGPFSIANKYINPAFIDVPKNVPALWGILRVTPDLKVLSRLIYYPERGIVYTQGWVLVAVAATLMVLFFRDRDLIRKATLRWISAYAIMGLVAMLWMNACFGGWHGGASAGPRYLAPILPASALLIPLFYARMPPWVRQLLVVTLVPSLVLYVLVFASTNILAAERIPLIESYFAQVFQSNSGERLFRVFMMLLGAGWAAWRTYATEDTSDGVQESR